MDSSNLSTSKNSVEISKLETKVDIPDLEQQYVEKANWPTNSNTPGPPKSADYRHDLSTSAFLNRLEKVASAHPREVIENPSKVTASEISPLTLKIKEKLNENIIDDLEDQIYTRLDKQNIFLEHPGDTINIDHLEQDTKNQLSKIFTNYENAFAKDNYDCGSYVGVVVHFNIQENKTAFQRKE